MKKTRVKLDKIIKILFVISDCFITLLVSILLKQFALIDMSINLIYDFVPFTTLFLLAFIITAFYLDMYKISHKKQHDVFICIAIAGVIASFSSILIALVENKINPNFLEYREAVLSVVTISATLLVWRLVLNIIINKTRVKDSILIIESSNIDISFAKKIKYSSLDWYDTWYETIDVNSEESVNKLLNHDLSKHNSVFITQSIPEHIKKQIVAKSIGLNKDVFIVPNLYEINLTKYVVTNFGDTPVFLIMPFRMQTSQKILKRVFDILFSLLGLLILSPVMLFIALAIKIDSKGSVIYTQQRVTLEKKVFNIYKFRTMVEDAEKLSGPKLASEDDNRITKVGKILRNRRLDEIPQLYNILKGDMSIVGPRPERPFFVDEFCKKLPDYDKRFIVKAGLTGYAQTYGRYDTDVSDKLLYDLLYIRQYSFMLDIKIILLTIRTFLNKGK